MDTIDTRESSNFEIGIIGGGAAGIFAAIAAANSNLHAKVTVYEKGRSLLSKVRISGGGRCNVTHACFDPKTFCQSYPRGSRELLGPFHQFQASDTVEWFESRGVVLKTEADGRMFPTTDSSQTVIDCLLEECRKAGVALATNAGVVRVERSPDERFQLEFGDGRTEVVDRLLIACGGLKPGKLHCSLEGLGHTLEPAVPSLFTFHIDVPWLRDLAGISIPESRVAIAQFKKGQTGPLLITHWGLSGPAILKLSAWEARYLYQLDYQFELIVDWLPGYSEYDLKSQCASNKKLHPAKQIGNTPISPIPSRLWEALVQASGASPIKRWAEFSRDDENRIGQIFKYCRLPVTGKSMNKEEFVTCGGVLLKEVNFKTMQSQIVPGLFLAGEVLDVDGITGGFNFQAAWTTGWIAGMNLSRLAERIGKP